jgi:hypothetical protein
MERDSMHDRGRALEEEYFRKKDRELLEKMRAAAAAEQARADLSAKTGLTDPGLVQELQELGFTPDTVSLLPLMPVIQVAWAEGGVTASERSLILKLARSRGIEDGSPADRQLADWLERRPSDTVFSHAARLIRAMLDSTSSAAGMTADDLVRYCESIAEASGGFFGINRVGSDEKQILASLAATLKKK